MSAASRRLAAVLRRTPNLVKAAYYAYRFFQPKYTIGVVGVVFNAAHEVLLVEHVFHPRLPWGLPGGWVGFNEDPQAAVIRELAEELGLLISDPQLICAQKTQFHHIDLAFACRVHNDVNKLSAELLGYRYWPLNALPRLHTFQYHAIMRASRGTVL